VLCCVTFYCTVLCCVTFYCTVLCRVVLCYVLLHCVVSCLDAPCCVVLRSIVLCCVVFCKYKPQDRPISYHKITPIYTAWFDLYFRQKGANLIGPVKVRLDELISTGILY
jgi:hypothetical protein